MYKSKGIRAKLFILALVPVLAFGVYLYIAMNGFEKLGHLLDEAHDQLVPNSAYLGSVLAYRNGVAYFSWAALNTHAEKEVFEEFVDDLNSAKDKFKTAIMNYEGSPQFSEEREIYEKIRSKTPRILELTDEIHKNIQSNTEESRTLARKQLNGGEWHQLVTDLRKTVQALIDFYQKKSAESKVEQASYRSKMTTLLLLVGGFAVLFLMVTSWFIARGISRSVGDISIKLGESGAQLKRAIDQLTASGNALSSSASGTASSLEETVASLEEMSSMTKASANNAQKVSSLSKNSESAVERGEREIKTLLTSMAGITDSSKKIEEIINVIDDIAFQTNLLALNAAVEAARAGEQGKGFAVVAEAVRALAQRSAEAAKDINQLIKNSVVEIQGGSQIANRSGDVMKELVDSVKTVSSLAEQIASAAGEQSNGIEQISQVMNALDRGAQANAAASEEIAATAEEISAQVRVTHQLIGVLEIEVLGDKGV